MSREEDDYASQRDNVQLMYHFFQQLSRRPSDSNNLLAPSEQSSTTPSPTRSRGASSDGPKVPPFDKLGPGRGKAREVADENNRARHDINAFFNIAARFKSSDPALDEKIRLGPETHDHFVLLPERRFRRNWDVYVMLLLMYTATFSAFVFSFLGVLRVSSPWFWIERFIDVSFIVDIVLNFYTAFERNGVLITDRKAIRHQYLTTWFVPDVVSTFPWDTIALAIDRDSNEGNSQLLLLPRYIRLVRLFKLLRLAKVLRLKQRFTEFEIKLRLKYGHVRLTSLFVTVMLVGHWFACLFYFFGVVSGVDLGWIGTLAEPEDSVLAATDLYDRYIAALYFSVYTITTIGYGDVTPVTTLERTYTTIIMFMGAALFAYVISQVSNVSEELNASSKQHRVMMDSLTDLAKYRQLPDDLVYDIRRYFQRDHLRQQVADEKRLIQEMNPDLRIRVLKHMYGTHVENSRFFREIPKESLDDVYASLSERLARRSEKLYAENERPHGFFIILSGTVRVTGPGIKPIEKGAGAIVGEEDILFDRARKNTATCTSYSDLVFVPRDGVMEVLRRYPKALKNLRDEEALWLWKDAILVVEQQIRFAMMANSLLLKGEKYVLRNNPQGVRVEPTQPPMRDSVRNNTSQLALSVVSAPEIERRSASAANFDIGTDDGLSVASEVGLDAAGPDGDASERSVRLSGAVTMEGLQRELDDKTRQVAALESKLLEMQTQLSHILGSIRATA